MYMAEFKLRYGELKWYVRRIVEADSFEKAKELAERYVRAINKGEVIWELNDIYEVEKPLTITEEMVEKLEKA
ncbi:hypothetical protein OCC_10214 [Thermococcus litoralis DSM 5473]|uniref:Uncharacterized protein n=1 Tax=Thermococcus litoralis (strain ATCC 51850 / DSM 5473 / JCM 8560 / NS-C) TaxID=523849 RepID=H3ZJL9_THELN|nr:hypothetical protein [Thermococcus litoralis]EHR79843.1 hypothetical protein OCC_10214 [Thermococcus litoralis DSM 5473]